MRSKSTKHKIAAALAATLVFQLGLPASAATRILKMRAHVGNINARPVTLPTGEVIDFPFVANILFNYQVFQHGYFEQASNIADVQRKMDEETKMGGELSSKAISASSADDDAALLKSYGFSGSSNSKGLSASGSQKISQSASTSPADVPVCTYNQPPIKLSGDVVAYEASDGGGLTIGYNGNKEHSIPAMGGSFQLKRQKLDMQFKVTDPFFPNESPIAAVPAKAYTTDLNIAFNIDLGFPIGINFFTKGSIADSIRSAMTKGLTAIIKEYDKRVSGWNKAWESRVIYSRSSDNDDTVTIAGGEGSYIHAGDTFRLTNMLWEWSGKPCQSQLRIDTIDVPSLGEAIGTVVRVGKHVTILKVRPINGHERGIMPGALVKIEKLGN